MLVDQETTTRAGRFNKLVVEAPPDDHMKVRKAVRWAGMMFHRFFMGIDEKNNGFS